MMKRDPPLFFVPGLFIAALIVIAAMLLVYLLPAGAQEIHHHDGQTEVVDKFYSTWLAPNRGQPRVSSCCNKMDCSPADIKRENGHWYGRRRTDANWSFIPDALIESNQGDPRESPDGQNHICISTGGVPLCAVLGSGG
jgi:hypothetical protein